MGRSFIWLVVVTAVAFFAIGARADSLSIAITAPNQPAIPGSTITFDAILTNTSPTDTIFLNGDSWTSSSPVLTLDDTPFLTNFPLSLDPGQSSGPFGLFSVVVDSSAAPGSYDFNSFSILGGLDDGSFEAVGTTTFAVTVASAVPAREPGILVLLVNRHASASVFYPHWTAGRCAL